MPIRRLYDFADTCVFTKQSLGPILCGPLRLRTQPCFTYHGLPFSRSYGDILPSSFSADHSSTLGYSPRLRVSVCGTVVRAPPARGFSWRHDYGPFAGIYIPFGVGARLKRSFLPSSTPTTLHRIFHHPTVLSLPRPPSRSNAAWPVQEY